MATDQPHTVFARRSSGAAPRSWLKASGGVPASPELLLATYAPSPEFQRRFDSIWATPEFDLIDFETHLDEVVAAGGDHAMLVADLRLV